MSERLDELVARLANAPTDRVLDDLEVEVGRSILLRRRDALAVSALAPVRFASIGLALAMGVTAGGAVAAAAMRAPTAYVTFSSSAHLAPSTLLEGRE
ncbi:hypothetical protein [Phenylobacterium sp.]|uniref:hypothetical protein n=1 Tax=Phenylobacterium sp. TaxID=1871053 RepID=UPI00374D463F